MTHEGQVHPCLISTSTEPKTINLGLPGTYPYRTNPQWSRNAKISCFPKMV